MKDWGVFSFCEFNFILSSFVQDTKDLGAKKEKEKLSVHEQNDSSRYKIACESY